LVCLTGARRETVDNKPQAFGVARIQLDPGATGKTDPDIVSRTSRLTDLDGKKLPLRVSLISNLSSPLVEGRGRDFMQVAEIRNGQVRFFMPLNQL